MPAWKYAWRVGIRQYRECARAISSWWWKFGGGCVRPTSTWTLKRCVAGYRLSNESRPQGDAPKRTLAKCIMTRYAALMRNSPNIHQRRAEYSEPNPPQVALLDTVQMGQATLEGIQQYYLAVQALEDLQKRAWPLYDQLKLQPSALNGDDGQPQLLLSPVAIRLPGPARKAL